MGVTMSVEENSNLSIKNWLAILVLAISTFIIVTTELAPVGLLTPMAKDFGVSESQIGVTVTIYAWVGAFSAILASVFLGNMVVFKKLCHSHKLLRKTGMTPCKTLTLMKL